MPKNYNKLNQINFNILKYNEKNKNETNFAGYGTIKFEMEIESLFKKKIAMKLITLEQ